MNRDKTFYTLALFIFVLFILAYSNHFNNPFQFDDSHVIQSNQYIRNVKNIPLFFKDATTTSSLPANQAYRPGLSVLNAVDYLLSGNSGDPSPFMFHVTIFLSFILLGVLLYFFFLKIFYISLNHKWNKYFALFSTAFFCLHTANAETINYISARTDSFSTLMVVFAFVIYQYKIQWRRKHIYLIPFSVGLFVKEPTIMFAPLLFLYHLFFEQKLSVVDIMKKGQRIKFIGSGLTALPALVIGIAYFIFSRMMTPPTWTSGSNEIVAYLITQPFVVLHYINNFYFPFNLSADTDWGLIRNIFDDRLIIGLIFIVTMLVISIKISVTLSLRLVSFGILWFFLALLPTSSIFPLSEVLNDHRVFFPYIGLVLVTVTLIVQLIVKFEKIFSTHRNKIKVTIFSFLFLGIHAYGVHQRNKIWSSGETLWKDVTIKSPNNARGLMNYGNSLMARGDYAGAENCYVRGIKLWPAYSYLYVNMGVLKAATNHPKEAESNFRQAMAYNAYNPECYYYFANFLKNSNRYDEAKEVIEKGLQVSPGHTGCIVLQNEINILITDKGDETKAQEKKVKQYPTAENFLNLSIRYYNDKRYADCVTAAQEALKFDPKSFVAYNNIGAACNLLGKFDEAVAACKKALELRPDFQLAKNNLNDILNRRKLVNTADSLAKKHPTDVNYINLSLLFYNVGLYEKSIEAATEAVKLNPRSDIAYNNICSAYNVLGQFDKAIEAGEKGIAINQQNELLKNNLADSRARKAAFNK